ncbi:RNA helicase [uncultured Senegalimassilia sp.]|uniref:DEAD/DEAH box helicase n=1 Tax=uncultured Senegalimassilia sp. TaxID=1714350 RepID=UPI00258AE7D1|nr:DEAD/DEAH box helicase [uncultured Senegalimassilia sp.]
MADIHTFEGEDIVETLAAQAEGHEPGELGALAYHLYDTNPDLTEEEAFEAFTGWVADRGIELWPHQEEALMSLMVGDHVILGTPTGSGKSLVALGMHFMAMCFGETSYYTAPIKALVSEKFFSLVELLGRDNVGMITGDVHINTDAPIICCTEEILANQALREGPDALIHSVAMDEFHFFSDTDRGWAWQVPLLTLPKTQFLLMSATLGDVTQIADLLRRQTTRDVSNVIDAPRPVPLSYEYALTPLEGTVELALRKNEGPLYIVHFSQDAALTSAQNLASYGVATKEQREAVKEAMKGAQFSTAFGKTLKRLLGCGVGVHHAGMLPRYRLLVEKLAQQGLLPVICGTDTLGVGINVPIHTVVLTQLTKFDGRKMRRLRSREFHQIAGRAGRSGFDTEGVVIAEAPEHEIENHKAEVKAAGDPKKLKKIKKKRPPENFVNWNEDTFKKLVDSVPEQLTPRMRITHSMVLAEVEQGGNARARVDQLIDDSLQPDEEKVKLHVRAAEVLQTLIDAGVVVHDVDENGQDAYSVTMDLPEDFALDQPLSPFLLAALELLDPESPEYAFDLVSMVEATLEDPRQVLRAQERKARDAAMAEMKMDGVDYDERLERIAEVTYPKPLEDLLDAAFDKYCDAVPWARDYCLRPKSVLRDMLESAADFKGYIQKLGIMRYEGILLRYLSEAFRGLDRTIPEDKRTEQLKDIIAWLGLVVRSVDSSLVDEWENAGSVLDAAPPDAAGAEAVVHDRRGLTVLVRNALFSRVRMAAHRDIAGLGEADGEWGFGERAWAQALDEYYEAHEEILLDADARSKAYLILNEADEEEAHVWHVRQIFHDEDGDNDFAIVADVDLDATQAGDGVVFKDYRVGFAEDLLGEW